MRPIALLAIVILGLAGCATLRASYYSPDNTIVTFTRSGGIAGQSTEVVFYPDGAWIRDPGADHDAASVLPIEDQRQLREMLAAVPWTRVGESYHNPDAADAYTFGVTLANGDRTFSTTANETALDRAPREFTRLVRYLDQLSQGLNGTR